MAAVLAGLVIFSFVAATARTRVVGCVPGHWRLGKSIRMSIGRVVCSYERFVHQRSVRPGLLAGRVVLDVVDVPGLFRWSFRPRRVRRRP